MIMISRTIKMAIEFPYMCLYKIIENVVCELLKTLCSTTSMLFLDHLGLNGLNLNIRFI